MEREFIVIIKYNEEDAKRYTDASGLPDLAPGEFLEREFNWLSLDGVSLDDWALVDTEHDWEAYVRYLTQWAIEHSDPACEGMCPASYQEWKTNERHVK